MTNAALDLVVEIAHRLPGRVRLRYAPRGSRRAPCPEALRLAALTLDGVREARVNPAARSLVLSFDPNCTGAERLRRQVQALGRQGELTQSVAAPPPPPAPGGLRNALFALIGTLMLPAPVRLPITMIASVPVLRHAWSDYRANGLTSHGLEGLAVSISLARGDSIAAATTIFLLTLGEVMEESIARRSDALLKTLLRPSGDEIWLLRDGIEILIPAGEVQIGDTVIVATGTVIPVDGTVLKGEATINEATMTGESVSVAKGRGDAVLSGTLVEEGRLAIYAEQVGAGTAAARIADYVEQSLAAKSEAQIEASRLADRLVPGVMRLAGASYLLTGDWRRAASVLQADYSCALKLATPVAFKAAMYAAGRAGVLVKGAGALERLAQADTFVFDKTGTLTTGHLEVTESIALDQSYSAEDLICLAASVEEHYFHPLALAVVNAARATQNHHHFDHQEVQFIVSHGVASTIDGRRIVVGSRHFIEEDEGIDLSAHRALIERLYLAGQTLLFIGFGGSLLGLIALKDRLRPECDAGIQRLRALGAKRILMLTGDHHDRAADLAAQLGLDGFHAGLLPQDKAQIITELAAQGHRIAFVGDGINDAPALAGAHVGIAMYRGADIARLTADVALLEDSFDGIVTAKAMANAAMGRIASNYHLTVGFNTAILAAAALGTLSPTMTAVLHNGTTIGILLNALRRPIR